LRRLVLVSFLVVFLSIPAAAQQPRITLVEFGPQSGPSTGGTLVTFRLSDIPNCPILAPPLTVLFGGVAGTPEPSILEEYAFSTPPHAPGNVEVRIVACGMEDIVVPGGFTFFQHPQGGPFQVQTISPAFGPTTGGTEVTVKVDDIPFCIDPIPRAALLFGGVEATNIRENQTANTITGVTPAHAAGAVDVTVRTCGGPTLTVGSGFTYRAGNENPNPAYEKVLFPVLFFGPGARGSQWATKISVYNAGEVPLTAANAVFEGDPQCPAVCGCQAGADVNPGMTALVCGGGFQDRAGLIYYAPRTGADDLHYNSRVFDTSRSTQNLGTEIPVVREREFRTDEIVLQDLPLDNNYRLALRVYNPDQMDRSNVRMQVLQTNSNGVLGERTIELTYPIVTIQPDPYPNRPAFAFVDLDPILRAIIPAGEFGTTYRNVTLKLTPITEEMRIWGFVSITNNDTQLITTVTPQY
jgi:hypothetical protein